MIPWPTPCGSAHKRHFFYESSNPALLHHIQNFNTILELIASVAFGWERINGQWPQQGRLRSAEVLGLSEANCWSMLTWTMQQCESMSFSDESGSTGDGRNKDAFDLEYWRKNNHLKPALSHQGFSSVAFGWERINGRWPQMAATRTPSTSSIGVRTSIWNAPLAVRAFL